MNTAEKPCPKAKRQKGAVNYKVIVGASLGNGLEIFDFTVYSFFAAIIGKLYFPATAPTALC